MGPENCVRSQAATRSMVISRKNQDPASRRGDVLSDIGLIDRRDDVHDPGQRPNQHNDRRGVDARGLAQRDAWFSARWHCRDSFRLERHQHLSTPACLRQAMTTFTPERAPPGRWPAQCRASRPSPARPCPGVRRRAPSERLTKRRRRCLPPASRVLVAQRPSAALAAGAGANRVICQVYGTCGRARRNGHGIRRSASGQAEHSLGALATRDPRAIRGRPPTQAR